MLLRLGNARPAHIDRHAQRLITAANVPARIAWNAINLQVREYVPLEIHQLSYHLIRLLMIVYVQKGTEEKILKLIFLDAKSIAI